MVRLLDSDELVIATHNAGKASEIEALLAPFDHPKQFFTARDLDLPEPEETGATFVANAELKALAAAQGCGKVSLADDSGLAVEALGGDPGIYSARWAVNESGERDFVMAMEKVKQALIDAGVEPEGASAAFICVLSLAWPDGHVDSFEGRVSGVLSFPPRGDKGFGYDPIFVPDGYTQSFAEMNPAEKHAISHRADAFFKFVQGCFAETVS